MIPRDVNRAADTRLFPWNRGITGFNYEVQGVFQERLDGRIKFHTYAVHQ
jgi:hypothetical protein